MSSLEDRIRGCLVGAAIGAGLGYRRWAKYEEFAVERPEAVLDLVMRPEAGYMLEEPGRTYVRPLLPFIALGVKAYLSKNGRVTPEDFGEALKADADISAGVTSWDGIHTTQELLKEGMQPRITGLGVAPSGLIAAAMPAVGIYHFGDPETAYLDGVELASVAQPRVGADWAALCAAAVAAAFATEHPGSVVDPVLKVARQNCPDVFYDIERLTIDACNLAPGGLTDFVTWWMQFGGRGERRHETNWIYYNPLRFVLPLLANSDLDAHQFMALLLAAEPAGIYDAWYSGRTVSAIIGGAIIGAAGGDAVFPDDWRQWAEPLVAPWLPLAKFVERRVGEERQTIHLIEKMAEPREDGSSLLHDKVFGCLLAGAIGNAMGSPVENLMYWEIDEKYPGGIQTVLHPECLETEDDNQTAMLLVETYLQRGGRPVTARHLGETWRQRMNRHNVWSLCMGRTYDLIREGWDPRITGHWSIVTGSTVMCMEPVGLFHAADEGSAFIDATAISYMYQRGRDVFAAATLAATVAHAMRPEATVDSILQAALDAAPRQEICNFDDRPFRSFYDYLSACLDIAAKYDDVLAVRAELQEKCMLYYPIDPMEVLGFSLAMFKVADGDVRRAAIGGTNIGRDSDTIAGRAAMLAGTLRGAGGVPEDWIKLFRPPVLEGIRRHAARFADVILAKTERLKARQAAAPTPSPRSR